MSRAIQEIRLTGPVTVAFRKSGGEWHAIALEFDILGTGTTREKALREMQELFSVYAEEILRTEGKVQFHFPAEPKDWDLPDRQYFQVVIHAKQSGKSVHRGPVLIGDISEVRRSLKPSDVKSVGLEPIPAFAFV